MPFNYFYRSVSDNQVVILLLECHFWRLLSVSEKNDFKWYFHNKNIIILNQPFPLSIKNLILKHSHYPKTALYVGYVLSTNVEFLPVMYMCDCWFPVSKDPGLNIYGFSFRISYGCIYYPLEAFWFAVWGQRKNNNLKWINFNIIYNKLHSTGYLSIKHIHIPFALRKQMNLALLFHGTHLWWKQAFPIIL